RIYAIGKTEGNAALAVVNRAMTAKGVKPDAPEKQIADAARTIPGADEVFLWDSVNWGEWALAYGKMAAVREGAADRIRREATIAMLADPKLEGGAPQRVLGRLHDQTPRVPFITGWASEKEAVRFLNESLKIDPTNKITKVFLAEAMVSNDSDTKPQATQMLKECLTAPNPPEYEVEQAAATGPECETETSGRSTATSPRAWRRASIFAATRASIHSRRRFSRGNARAIASSSSRSHDSGSSTSLMTMARSRHAEGTASSIMAAATATRR